MSKPSITKAQFVELSKGMDPVDIIRKYTISDSPEVVDPVSVSIDTQKPQKEKTEIKPLPIVENSPPTVPPTVNYCSDCGAALQNGNCPSCIKRNQKSKISINWILIGENINSKLAYISNLKFPTVKLPSLPRVKLPRITFNKKWVISLFGLISLITLTFFSFKYLGSANLSNVQVQNSSSSSITTSSIVPTTSTQIESSNVLSETKNKELEDMKKQIDDKNNEINDLKKQLGINTNSNAYNATLEGQKTELTNKVLELQKNLEDSQKLNKELANTTGANTALTNQVDNLNKQIDIKNKELDTKNQTIANQNTQIDNKNKDYQNLSNTNNDLANKLNTKVNDYNNLQQTNQSLTQNYNNLLNRPPVQCTVEYTISATGVKTKTYTSC